MFPTFHHRPKCFQHCQQGFDGFSSAPRRTWHCRQCPCHQSSANIIVSKKVTAPLVAVILWPTSGPHFAAIILQQSYTYLSETKEEQVRARKDTRKVRKQQKATAASKLEDKLLSNILKTLTVSAEKGASSWLSTLPLRSMNLLFTRVPLRMHYACPALRLMTNTSTFSLHLWTAVQN